jgi:thymidylate synthase
MTQANIHEEYQYLHLIHTIVENGHFVKGRNGMTKTLIGANMRFSLKDMTIPILTTKKVAWKTCLKELLWFINGSTDNKLLQQQNVKIWNANASRDFLDSRGLQDREEDDLGPVYGFQWRHFNAPYSNCNENYSNKGIDQLAYIIEQLKDPKTRFSRRLIMTAWNPCQLNEMALPPCHLLCQFNVVNTDELSCCLYQRSGDVGLGVPFNIASYSFLTHIIASICNLKATEFVYFISNAHIYDDHLEDLVEQTKRCPYRFPKLHIKLNTEENEGLDIDQLSIENFSLENYQYHEPIVLKMRK